MSAPTRRARRTSLHRDRQWIGLRLKAAKETDPFKLAVILSEMAALAAKEQQHVLDQVRPNVHKYNERRSSLDDADPPAHPISVPSDLVPGDSAEAVSRFLRLAATALRNYDASSHGAR